ncbi:hypothetical protein AK830_g4335 [Neonectria ditissima]|uniref:F-box domain-containing protein n=1 Tax=Neonectria ditissima TaxID=78410 RepID=A0A0P7BNA7_9HYPO|nr:hypothetical protein AK830_g4335 [Neonectria ditissima]
MELDDFPEELLSHILRCLYRPEDAETYDEDEPDGLLNTRLVCRKWNVLATAFVFRTVSLIPSEGGFKAWHAMLDSQIIRAVARRVVINSSRADFTDEESEEQSDEDDDDDDENSKFRNALSRIGSLALIDKICLRFTPQCYGVQTEDRWAYEDYESIGERENTLEAVFKAIKNRASKPDNSKIRSLTIENLQNIPLPDFTSSELFKSVTNDLDQLHLKVSQEYNEHGPDRDIYLIELQQFEPYMHKHWLSPMADQLTSLSLYFTECWGTMPAIFKGYGLVFPQLKTLNPGNFTISHDDHLDWVLAQTSLKSLRLDRCFIVSHIRTDTDMLAEWNTDTEGWERLPMGAYGFNFDNDAAFYYPGTWESVFDKIRTGLPNLVDFQFHLNDWGDAVGFNDPSPLPAELSFLRYITFDRGLLPSRWIEARSYNGDMGFGDNDPSGSGNLLEQCKLNRSEETREGDERALQALVEATLQRRW